MIHRRCRSKPCGYQRNDASKQRGFNVRDNKTGLFGARTQDSTTRRVVRKEMIGDNKVII